MEDQRCQRNTTQEEEEELKDSSSPVVSVGASLGGFGPLGGRRTAGSSPPVSLRSEEDDKTNSGDGVYAVCVCVCEWFERWRVDELTDWAGGVCLDHAAEICDRLLQKSSLPVQHVPDRKHARLQQAPGGHIYIELRVGHVLREVGDELDVGDDQLVLQQQVFEEDVFLQQGDGLGAEQTHQQLRAGTLQAGSAGAISWLLRETQRLQDAVLT